MELWSLRIIFQVLMVFGLLWLATCTTNKDCFCFKFNIKKLSWTKGQEKCKDGGGDLVSMETEEKWKFINSVIQEKNENENEWHIGLKKAGEKWKWLNNQSLTLNKWQKGEPNDDGKCAAMVKNFPKGTQGLFKDLACYVSLMYICEYKQETSSCEFEYPSNCNHEVQPGSTSSKSTKMTIPTTQPTTGNASDGTAKTTSNSSLTTDVVDSTVASTYTTENSNNTTSPFSITLVIVLSVLLVVCICLSLVVFFWKWKKGNSKSEMDSRKPSQKPMNASTDIHNESRGSILVQHISGTDGVVIYDEINDGQTGNIPPVPSTYDEINDGQTGNVLPASTTYAEVDDYLSPVAPQLSKYASLYATVDQNIRSYHGMDKSTQQEIVPKTAQDISNQDSEYESCKDVVESKQHDCACTEVNCPMKTLRLYMPLLTSLRRANK